MKKNMNVDGPEIKDARFDGRDHDGTRFDGASDSSCGNAESRLRREVHKTGTYRELMHQFYRKNGLRLAASVFSAFLIGVLGLMASWLLKEVVDTISGVDGAYDLKTLFLLSLGLLVYCVFLSVLQYTVLPAFFQRANRQYKEFAFRKLTEKHIAAFGDENISLYLSALSNDVTTIETDYLNGNIELIVQCITLIGSFAMMIFYSPVLTVITVVLTLIPIAVSVITGGRLGPAQKEVSEKNEKFTASLKDCLNGYTVIKSFKAEKEAQVLFSGANTSLENGKRRRWQIQLLVRMTGMIAAISTQLGVFLVGAFMIVGGFGNLTPGVVLVFLNLVGMAMQPIQTLPALLAGRKAARGLVQKLADALDRNSEETGSIELAQISDAITVEHVDFGYEEDKNILENVNLCLEAGKSYAIVGGSGSGKSTLLSLLMGAYPVTRGAVRYDGFDIQDIRSASRHDLVSSIQQNVFVFDASIVDNITMFKEFPDEEIRRAVEQASLSEFIAERGSDYLCGDNGRGLSGGEKQRISIARSLLKKSSVLLADEATASLDAETARQVIGVILGLEGMTRIVVTHALDGEVLKQFDEIITMKKGKIVEKGTFAELFEKKGYFYSLFTVSQ